LLINIWLACERIVVIFTAIANLLQTSLTELEREFVEKRLGEEQSALENLATILPNGAMNF
jgi:hypothetical protein